MSAQQHLLQPAAALGCQQAALGQILQRRSIAFSKTELKRGSSDGVAGGFLDPAGLGAKCKTIHEEWAGNEG